VNTRTEPTAWSIKHSIETTASAEAIWHLLSDVAGWKTWNAGVKDVQIDGPFATGTRFQMTLPTGETFSSLLREVQPRVKFSDETQVDDLLVRVSHEIESLSGNCRRVTYALEAIGPMAAEVGPGIASDFPQVLQALAKRAEAMEVPFKKA
jgi:hypothetical protein